MSAHLVRTAVPSTWEMSPRDELWRGLCEGRFMLFPRRRYAGAVAHSAT